MIRLLKFWFGIPQQQTCPVCQSEVEFVARYPDYVCRDCCQRTVDAEGRPLDFFNVDLSGGFCARYTDNQQRYESHQCFIDGKQCHADEAHFGGIVIRCKRG